MKIATWNVNSIRQRAGHVRDWLASEQPDVLALQEIKCQAADFPAAEFEPLGYRAIVDGQKAYNGVAFLFRGEAADVVRGIPGFEDEQKRVLAATFGELRLIDLYVPNGQSVGSEKYEYKLRWFAALGEYLRTELARSPKLALLGDFNVAPEDRDVHDPEAWRGQVLCSDAERAALGGLLALGVEDLFRRFEQSDKAFSWWDYRAAAFRRNLGLRIDLVLGSRALAATCTGCGIDVGPRRREQPSDHTPVWATFQ